MPTTLALALLLQTAHATPAPVKPPATPTPLAIKPAGLAGYAKGRKINPDALKGLSTTKPAAGTPGPQPAGPGPGEKPGPGRAEKQNENERALEKAYKKLEKWVDLSDSSGGFPQADADAYERAKNDYEEARRACAADPECHSPLAESRLKDRLDQADEKRFRADAEAQLRAGGTYSEANVEALVKAWRESRKK